jgi:hypothetical protein
MILIVIIIYNIIVFKPIPQFQVMRNMVGYVIVAHKPNEKGLYTWNNEVIY